MIQHLVIIPTYNERENISLIIEKIFSLTPSTTGIMVVDDNSPDGTAEVVQDLMKHYSRLSLFKREQKEGLGRAYIAAFKKSFEHKDYLTLTMMDADLSHNPKYLSEMFKLSEKYDLVIGSRGIAGGGTTREWGLRRKLLTWGANLYLRIIFRFPIYDWTGGFMTIRTSILKMLSFDLLNPRGYSFTSSFKYYLLKAGARFIEIPILFEQRRHGASKMSLGVIFEAIWMPWKILIGDFMGRFRSKST